MTDVLGIVQCIITATTIAQMNWGIIGIVDRFGAGKHKSNNVGFRVAERH